MKAERHGHLSLPLSSRLPGSSGGSVMTPITELLLQGGSHCLALHLEVPRLRLGGGQPGWTSGAEPIVHKDETLSCLIYLSVELKFFPARNQTHSSRWRRPCVTFYLNSQTSAFCSIGLRFTCLFLIHWSFLGAFAFKISQISERCAEETQKYDVGLDSPAQFSRRQLSL